MNASELNGFSRHVAARLFELYPEWRRFARSEHTESEKGILFVEVPSPATSDLETPLRIITANEEIEVGFDYYHDHFEVCADVRETVSLALEFISNILEERVVAVSWWSSASFRGASSAESGSQPQASEHVNPFDRVRIRSWKGRYDEDIRV